MPKKLNTIQQRNFNNLLTAVESNDRTTAKELFELFFKGKEIEEVVIDKLKEKHDIAYLTEESVEPKKAAVAPKKVNDVTQKKEKKKLPTKLEPAKTVEEKSRANLFTEMLDHVYQLLDPEQKELFNTLVETEMSFK